MVQDVGQQISEMGQCMQLSPRGMYGMIINKFSEFLTEKFIAFRFGFRCDGVGVEGNLSKFRNRRLYVGFIDENDQNPGIRRESQELMDFEHIKKCKIMGLQMNQLIAAPDGSGSLQQEQKVETVKTLWFAIQFVF